MNAFFPTSIGRKCLVFDFPRNLLLISVHFSLFKVRLPCKKQTLEGPLFKTGPKLTKKTL